MNSRKIWAPLLFDGHELRKNSVLLTDEKGIIDSIVNTDEAGENIERWDGILCPGFVNCHCHLELSHMRGLIPKGTGLVDFVFSVVSQRHFAEQEIAESIAIAEEEMSKNGIVAAGDICNTSHTAEQKMAGNLAYYNFVEVSGWLPGVAQARVEAARRVSESLSQNGNHPFALVPHAPYSVSEKLWFLLQPYFENKRVSIHNQETSFEDELFIQGGGDFMRMYNLMKMDSSFFLPSGKSSLQTYLPKLAGAHTVMLVHNTFTQPTDVAFASETCKAHGQQLYFCLCPNANLYIENALPPAEMLLQQDCQLVLGTDSLASNDRLSIASELQTMRTHFPTIPLARLLQMATLNGAKALGMQERFGSFEKGKQPGVLGLSKDLATVKRLL